LGLRGVGDCQPFQNIIITILNHEHFSHGMSTFNGNNVKIQKSQFLVVFQSFLLGQILASFGSFGQFWTEFAA
jgi:hypothetical protein